MGGNTYVLTLEQLDVSTELLWTTSADLAFLSQALIQTPRWQKNDGADYIFYDPHPGFATGRAEGSGVAPLIESDVGPGVPGALV